MSIAEHIFLTKKRQNARLYQSTFHKLVIRTTTTVLRPLYRLAGTSSEELEDFVGAKFYCPHALADGNQRIRTGDRRRWSSPQRCYLHCLRTVQIND